MELQFTIVSVILAAVDSNPNGSNTEGDDKQSEREIQHFEVGEITTKKSHLLAMQCNSKYGS